MVGCLLCCPLSASAEDFYNETKVGMVALEKGDLTEAETHLKRARDIAKKNSNKYGDYATSLLNLGKLFQKKKNAPAAEKYYQDALAIYLKSYGEDSLETSSAYHGLAEVYRKEEKYEKAMPLYEKAVRVRERAAPDHTDLADTSSGLAECYGKLGRKNDSIPLMKRVVAIRQKALGKNDPRVAKSYFILANLYEEIGKPQMAIPIYEKVVSVCEAAYGVESPKVATTLEHLGTMYVKDKKLDRAELSYKRALDIRDKNPKDVDKLDQCLKAYAEVLKKENKSDKAAKMEARISNKPKTTSAPD